MHSYLKVCCLVEGPRRREVGSCPSQAEQEHALQQQLAQVRRACLISESLQKYVASQAPKTVFTNCVSALPSISLRRSFAEVPLDLPDR